MVINFVWPITGELVFFFRPLFFSLSFPAPTFPRMFLITSVMTTSFNFSWQPPLTLNGVLTGYRLSCQPLLPGISLPQPLNTTALMVMLSNLYPSVGYNCSIVARNSAGPSYPVYVNGTTLETGASVYVVCSITSAKIGSIVARNSAGLSDLYTSVVLH